MTARLAPSIAALLLTAALAGCAGVGTPPPVLVEIHDGEAAGGFEPSTITVPAGTEVRWSNAGSRRHGVTTEPLDAAQEPIVPAGAEGWESGVISPGETFSLRLDMAGTYVYRCSIHGEIVGVIQVEEQ
ncbi:cupredoxin domain-containing protein [Salinibacterium sp. SYSU T00001]|uniref:cupredoxin domain-containing protein n=1 Tax=Homoserinimonas sedimenticola TaxID=2986805 RepID=UPI0022369875|nr:plastocyanin/azurin family copper-binding protein [Salinibacterium sedimenticola]MCW4384785.1 cupredoxin domain-containing protein [Salinibacterium sedimenticola]